MILEKHEVPLQHQYRSMCADLKLHQSVLPMMRGLSGYCIDAPLQLMPSGCCVNDGDPKQGCTFVA